MRRYVRQGSLKELWPIFHATKGRMEALVDYEAEGSVIKEDVFCYSYNLKQVDQYVVFNLVVGIDSWFICLNDMFATPVIREGFPDQAIKLIWYSKDEWK